MIASWFRLEERATIIGFTGLSQLLGVVIGQIATPLMLEAWGMRPTMLTYGVLGVASALVFIAFARDHPPTPAGREERVLMLAGLKHIFTLRDFYLLAFIVFVINAIFNGILTWVEVMVRPRGLDLSQAGLIGGLLMIGGVFGLLVFPAASDRLRKRKPVLVLGALPSIPFLVLMAYVHGFALLAIVTCTFGNLAAYGQTNIKRLLAYSTVAQAGYMMMPVPAAMLLADTDPQQASAAIGSMAFYAGVYLVMNLGAFAIVAFLRNTLHSRFPIPRTASGE